MGLRSGFARFVPRSLWAQTILGLLACLAVSAVSIGPWMGRRFSAEFGAELERRGRATVQTLEKHSDLRLAISLADDKQAMPILAGTVSADDDVLYVAILSANRAPIAWAPSSLSAAQIAGEVGVHFVTLETSDAVRRFTQPVTRGKEAAALEFGADPAEKQRGDLLGYVVLGLKTKAVRDKVWTQTLSWVGVGALVLFTLFILAYFRWVAVRLIRMGQFAQQVATGELRGRIDDPFEDDLGRLASALRSMSAKTGDVVSELVSASRQLSNSSSEMFDAASQQAGNASKQAASVTEMGATVAELRETFNQATAKAEAVIDLARRSEESSSGGTAAVGQSIDGMLHIREQVAAIAHTIDGLVQRTDQIDAIIDVVNDLAEQSNVLALNAGIEAARAGEHGRGFAVVAREVRSLAERSKESTAQVRAILQDIKIAGREAVRAIQEGSRRAESGMQVAQAAGDAIRRLGDAIAASSASAMQIASSTRQQSVGVEQIWQATKEIDRIATESAQGIQRIEEAAGNMKQIAATMGDIVGRYRIERREVNKDGK